MLCDKYYSGELNDLIHDHEDGTKPGLKPTWEEEIPIWLKASWAQ